MLKPKRLTASASLVMLLNLLSCKTMEGPDDMPAHAKCSLFGVSLTIPITNGKLNLGTWQGIYLCEF